jgi:hypothetical protein
LPDITRLQESTIVGSFSYCLMESRQRLIKRPECLAVDHTIETPPAVARDFLTWRYKRGPIVKHIQMESIKAGMKAVPNFAHPTNFMFGYYVDIQSAYWSIMNVVGWKPDYYPEKWLSAGEPPVEFPFAWHKRARNCLASAGTSTELPVFNPASREIEPRQIGNPLSNLSLTRLITDVLNCIASQAIEAGAVYANTDGFICPNVACRDRVMAIIENWGLIGRVKLAGPGVVLSSGAYQVGKGKSGLLKYREAATPIVNVSPPKYSAWLERNFAFWAGKRSSYVTGT